MTITSPCKILMSKEHQFVQAVLDDDLATVRRLVADRQVDVNCVDPHSQVTAFYRACGLGRVAIVRFLLTQPRVNVTRASRDKVTPLYVACSRGHVEVVTLLLADKRVDVNAAEKAGCTPFYIASGLNRRAVMRVLMADSRVKLNRVNNNGVSPLYLACHNGNDEVAAMLLDDPRVDVNRSLVENATPFFIACQQGLVNIVTLLLADERTDPNKAMNHNITPLWFASQFGHLLVVQHLLASGRRINVSRRSSWNNRTAAEHARSQALLEKFDDETDEEYKRRAGYCPQIAELIDEYSADPAGTCHRLRRCKGVRELYVAEVFALVVLLSDHFLKFRMALNSPSEVAVKRFFAMLFALPMELQMMVCNRVFGSSRDAVLSRHLALALKRLYHQMLATTRPSGGLLERMDKSLSPVVHETVCTLHSLKASLSLLIR